MKPKKDTSTLRGLADLEKATAKKARASWQMFTILAEFIEATEYLSEIRPAVCIYGSARIRPHSPYYRLTVRLARKLSDAGFAVISGGGPGIMQAANKGAHAGSSPSVGLNIELPHEQLSNRYQDVSLRFRHFFTRKVTFTKNSDAIVVMPGGFGTLDELAEALALIQTGQARPVPIILVGRKFWQGLLSWFQDSLLEMGLISPADLALLQLLDDPDEVLQVITTHHEQQQQQHSAAPTQLARERMFYF